MSASEVKSVAIVGGGVLGMSVALRLAQAGADVTVYEASDNTGGLADEARFGPITWDRFYHVVLLSDLRTRALLAELDMSDRLRWGVSRTGFYTDGLLHSMSDTIEFLKFKPLGLIDKLRLGGTIFLGSKIKSADSLEKTLAVDWLGRYSGKRVLEKIWLPLLKSKLGDNYKIASAAFIWAIIARMYAARRSGLKQEMFGYIDGGYGPVIRKMQDKLESLGVKVKTGAPVRNVSERDGRRVVEPVNGDATSYDHVVMTTMPGLAASICSDLTDKEKERMQAVPYQGVICAAVLMKKPLSPFYVTNITDGWVPFTGVIEMTALVDKSSTDGYSLVYLPLYLGQEDSRWDWDDERIESTFIQALDKMYPDFDQTDVVDFSVSRARQVLAISTLDYSTKLLPPMQQSAPCVWFVNSAQIAHGTLNVNETLGLAEQSLPALCRAMGLEVPAEPAFSLPDPQMLNESPVSAPTEPASPQPRGQVASS